MRRVFKRGARGAAALSPTLARSFIVALTLTISAQITSGHAGEAAQAAGETATILALGDSLTAGYGLPPEHGFTAKLEAALADRGHAVTIENAGVSGDTSAGGKARLDWSLSEEVDAAIVELGSNDALRGLDPADTEANLAAIIEALQARDIEVLLAGMLAPPNLGPEYGEDFNTLYPRLAEKYGVELYPFFLDGVAADPALNQADGIHPNAEGVDIIVERITPYVERLIARIEAADSRETASEPAAEAAANPVPDPS